MLSQCKGPGEPRAGGATQPAGEDGRYLVGFDDEDVAPLTRPRFRPTATRVSLNPAPPEAGVNVVSDP